MPNIEGSAGRPCATDPPLAGAVEHRVPRLQQTAEPFGPRECRRLRPLDHVRAGQLVPRGRVTVLAHGEQRDVVPLTEPTRPLVGHPCFPYVVAVNRRCD